jgi:hypothetical protein
MMQTPLNQNLDQKLDAGTRARLAFLFMAVFVIALSVGAYFIANLGKFQQSNATHESLAAAQGATDPQQLDEALRRNPSNKLFRMIAMAIRAANQTSTAAEKLLNEVEPPANSKDLATAARGDLEALGRDLKAAEARATAFVPRYIALLKTERDKVETYALSLHAEKDVVGRFLDGVDKQHAKTTDVTSRLLSARADYYRAYESYVAVLVGEFGAYKVVNGQFIFPLQRTVDRYNVAAHAMTVATRQIAELEQERKTLTQSQREEWAQLVNSK